MHVYIYVYVYVYMYVYIYIDIYTYGQVAQHFVAREGLSYGHAWPHEDMSYYVMQCGII